MFDVTGRLFDYEREAQKLLTQGRKNINGTLRFFADAPLHAVLALGRLRVRHPGIQVSTSSWNSATVRGTLPETAADVGIIGGNARHPHLAREPLTHQGPIAITPRGSSLAETKSISIWQLYDSPLVNPEIGSKTRKATEVALALRLALQALTTKADSRESVEAGVLAGTGTALIGEGEFSHDPRLVMLDFTDDLPSMQEFLIIRFDRKDEATIVAAIHARRSSASKNS